MAEVSYDTDKWTTTPPKGAVDYDTSKWSPSPPSADPLVGRPESIGPTPATGEMHAGHPLLRFGEEVGRTGAFMGGEAAGALTPVPGGAAMGAGLAGTTADAVIAWINHKVYGTPIDDSRKAIGEDFAINAGSSLFGRGVGKVITGAIPGEAETVREAAERGMGAQRAFTEGATASGQKAMTDVAGAQQQALGEVTPAAQAEQITGITGRTEQTAIGAGLPKLEPVGKGKVIGPSAETVMEQRGPRKVYYDIEHRIGDAYGDEYEDLLKDQGRARGDITGIFKVNDKWDAIYAKGGHDAPALSQKLFKRALDIAPKSFVDTAAASVKGKIPKNVEDKLIQLGGGAQDASVDRILAFRREAQREMVGATNFEERGIAGDYVQAANEALAKSSLPQPVRDELGKLNARYADYRTLFNLSDIRAMAKGQTALDYADHIYSDPVLTERLARNANPEESQILKDNFGDWARANPGKLLAKTPVEAGQKAQAYGALFPGTPLADPKAISYIGATMDNISSTPQAQAAFQASVEQARQQAVNVGAKAIRNLGLSEAKHMGPAGQEIIKAIGQAKTPEEAANIAINRVGGMTSEELVQKIAGAQGLAKASVAGKLVHRDESMGNWIKRVATNPESWGWIAGMGALQTVAYGHPGFYGIMAGLGAVPFARRVIANAFVQGLKDPAMAQQLIAGTVPASRMMFQPWAGAIVKGLADEAGSSAMKMVAGDPLAQPNPRDTAPLPGLEAEYQKAQESHDADTTKEIRNTVIQRLKRGEWKDLDPATQRKLAPWLREMRLGA